MALVTYADYSNLGYSDVTDEKGFAQVAAKAERAVAAITNYYYRDHDITNEQWPARAQAYRQAICEQVDFIQSSGIAASYDSGDDFKTISVGRMSLAPASTVKADSLVNGVCKEAYSLLAHYGLLYRGRGSVWYATTDP